MTQRRLFFCFVTALSFAAVPGWARVDFFARANMAAIDLAPAAVSSDIIFVAADCSRAAGKASAQTGGRVLSVSSRNQNGRPVCVVTVLVPADGGGRPRKRTVTVPQ